MKRIVCVFLSCLLLLSLCACTGGKKPTDPAPSEPSRDSTSSATEQTQPSEVTTADTTAAPDAEDPKALANSCLEKSVDELYALIGQPQSSDYAPSCLGPGEDGMLYYDGFIVYTYRENGVETVDYVE